MPPRAIEQHARADDVRVNEVLRRIDAAVDMRFGGEIDDRIERVLRHERVDLLGVGDVGLEKLVALAVLLGDAVEIRQIAGVGQNIHIADRSRLVMLQNIANKVAPDEPTATGNQNAHRSAY